MLLIYRYMTPFPNDKAHSIQIAHTIHALARAGAEVWFFPSRYTKPSPSQCLAPFGLEPHDRLHLRSHPSWTSRSRRWRGSLISLWERRLFGRRRNRRPVFFLRDGADSFRYALRLKERKRDWSSRIVLESHRVHRVEAEELSRTGSGEVPKSFRRRAAEEGDGLRAADGLIAISESLARCLSATYDDLPPIRVVRSGCSVAEVDDLPLEQRRGVIYAGQLYPWKGVEQLIEAISLAPDVELTLVGGNDDGDVRRLRDLARNRGVLDRVAFAGQTTHVDVMHRLRRARCAVIPSGNGPLARSFTSPMKLFEYMNAGTPIVSCDSAPLREVLTHERNAVLFDSSSSESFSAAIVRVLRDDALAERLRRQARLDVRHYSWDARARQLLEFCESLG